MLRQRVITALVMAGLFLAGLALLSLPALALLFGMLVALGAWEWSRLAGWQSRSARVVYVLLLGALLGGLYHYCELADMPQRERVQPFLGLACLWWSFALLWVKGYPNSAVIWRSAAISPADLPAVTSSRPRLARRKPGRVSGVALPPAPCWQ